MLTKSPYLSIVVTTRNDNHGGDLLKRTIAFVNGLIFQCEKYKLHAELIIVEWNPPKDKPLLKEVLPPPPQNTFLEIKYIVVPEEIHKTYKTSSTIPLYQMTAKNVGIRRAKGEFILCTNIDILFSDECFKIFAQQKLKQNVFYRANRCDVKNGLLDFSDFKSQLEYAKANVITRHGKSPDNEALLNVPRFIYYFPRIAALLNKLVIGVWKMLQPGIYPHFTIDFMACGDFTLMSKKDWMELQGYAELDMYSIHIDSMALWAATALGKKQIIFPYKAGVYHIYHEDGWESDDVLKTIRFLESKPCLDYSIVFKGGMQIVSKKQNWNLNSADWGFANKHLKEYIFEPGKPMQEIN